MTVNGNIPVQRSVLPSGDAGTDATVRKMVDIAMGKWGAKSAKIRALAIDIVREAGVREKDYQGEAVAIFNWVRDRVRYIKDPIGQETLSHPEETAFNSRAGDCDDKTVLTMALLGSLGIPSYPVVVGTRPDLYTHVYLHAVVPPNNTVIPMDPIMRWPAGKEATQGIQRKKLYNQYAGISGMSMHGYVSAPSYLDQENAQAERLLANGSAGGTAQVTAGDGVNSQGLVNSTAQVTQAAEGVDGMFGGAVLVPEPRIGQPGAFVSAREDAFGRTWTNAPQIYDARNVGPLGPLIQRDARMETERMASIQAREIPTASGTVRREIGVGANRRTMVTIRPRARGIDKPLPQQAAEAQALHGYVQQIACMGGCGGCHGLGYISPAMSSDVVEDAALLAWWAQVKADIAKATEVALQAHDPAVRAFAKRVTKEAQRAADAAKAAERKITAKSPEAKLKAAEVKAVMAKDSAASGFGYLLAGLGNVENATPMTTQNRADNARLQALQAQRQHHMAAIAKIDTELAEIRKRLRALQPVPIRPVALRPAQPTTLLYPGKVTAVQPPARSFGRFFRKG